MRTSDLRAAVDGAIRRHLESRAPSPAPVPAASTRSAPPTRHPSHARIPVLDGAASGGPCVIEPTVACIHCGHCQTQGY